MATGDSQPAPQAPARDIPRPAAQQPPAVSHGASSPPSKRDLTSWWKQFVRNTKKDEEPAQSSGIFGVPLNVSIKYANVAISLSAEDGSSFIYGYVPIVVAKCGVFLKERATDVEGIFRLSGSAKRIKDLQDAFDSPDRYGKGLDWTGYTVHDAANILRRYLNQLPEPIVPLDFYERFRDPLRNHQAQAVGDKDAKPEEEEPFDHAAAVDTYQQLIKELPPLNRQLLLYILDLLTVFASKSEINRMTAANLAAIFQPGMLSHPAHDMAPKEYKLSQDVLIFLIENQDNFLFGMTGTGADAQTVKAMQAGNASNPPLSNLRRSASNASGGADSLRKYDALRRNVSVSSKHSKNSVGNATSPATPNSVGGGSFGVHRSNTVPTKKLGALSPNNFSRPRESSPKPDHLSPAQPRPAPQSPSQTPSLKATGADTTAPNSPSLNTNPGLGLAQNDVHSHPASPDEPGPPLDLGSKTGTPQLGGTPTKERKLSSLFRSTPPDGERKDARQPNRLRKKRPIPGSTSESARSSNHSLPAASEPPLGILVSQAVAERREASEDQSQLSTPKVPNPVATSATETVPQQNFGARQSVPVSPDNTLRPGMSRTPSLNSRSSVTDHSDFDHQDDAATRERNKEQRRSWRFPRGMKRNEHSDLSLSPPPRIGSNSHAGFSSSSVGSSNWPQKSFTNESRQISPETSATGTIGTTGNHSSFTLPTQDSEFSNAMPLSNPNSNKDTSEPDRRSFFGKFKAKVAGVKEGAQDREGERERTKSPPHSEGEKASSRNSLSFIPGKEAKTTSIDSRPTENPEPQQPAPVPEPVPEEAPASVPSAPAQVPSPSPPTVPGSFPEPAIPEESSADIPAEVSTEASTQEPAQGAKEQAAEASPTGMPAEATAERPPTVVAGDILAETVAVLPKVEEEVPQSPRSTTETVKAAAPVQPGIAEGSQSLPESSSKP
ncbi:hypothetical protein AJ79_05835 [Helicocarpus griseus UAMH5409]|uniref:Rho-GAP domain-containing protein n=1 Tax=Helicocarpus griseus UAMH5409 TaxID=1447875 RepID=A0A2B7XJ68_9EURO|nr:hypothetical protein AJ79_05835 [Helicocarpus griseus UAMH5409]